MKTFFAKLKSKLTFKYVLMLIVMLGVLTSMWLRSDSTPEKSLSTLVRQTTLGQVAEVKLDVKDHVANVERTNGKTYEVKYPSSYEDDLIKLFETKKVAYTADDPFNWFGLIAAIAFPVLLFGAMLFLLLSSRSNVITKYLGKQNFIAERPATRFKDVKGADEAIEDLQMTVDALRDPANYKGPRIDQGILLEGPTGTGKTLIARAVAGEAGVLFYYLSGPQLTSMFVNASAALVNNFFNSVKKDMAEKGVQSAVIFVDELEGLLPVRTHGMISAGQGERNTTVTAMLHQLGILFEHYQFVVVIGATNHKEGIDPAILRPGRLGKHIMMPNPDASAREQMVLSNMEGLVCEGTVDVKALADLMSSMSGAQVAEVVAEARRLLYRKKLEIMTMDCMREAVIRIAMGVPRMSAKIDPEDARITAVHESGHTIAVLHSKRHTLQHVTIIPIGESGGSTWHTADDRKLHTLETIMDELTILFGGLAAEETFNPNESPSMGASHDLQRATQIATSVVCTTSIGGIVASIDPENWESHPQANEVNAAVRDMLDKAHAAARNIIRKEQSFLKQLQEMLLEERSAGGDKILALRENGPIAIEK